VTAWANPPPIAKCSDRRVTDSGVEFTILQKTFRVKFFGFVVHLRIAHKTPVRQDKDMKGWDGSGKLPSASHHEGAFGNVISVVLVCIGSGMAEAYVKC
jgi:hypothetical protein